MKAWQVIELAKGARPEAFFDDASPSRSEKGGNRFPITKGGIDMLKVFVDQ